MSDRGSTTNMLDGGSEMDFIDLTDSDIHLELDNGTLSRWR
ncbi:hypothetical protein FPSE_01507 [Fusarium pseudograminearum CS3096]|uniref:Uncharacterized protein n=1 Tax=Fusarium pseudograminearum (strain CS3096) TaxID=1028729 RepID=K3UZQ9_FUSPC|nr:hypothetical protein FPSE_01507 [Fusarium pseudograminearum CS3096]EKJ78321.1 hypothetical protein FPSE_01507 [Fusarium pseudograminearum CS3096]